MSSFDGAIIWADLIPCSEEDATSDQSSTRLINPFDKKIEQRIQRQKSLKDMVLIPRGSFVMGRQ